MKESIKTVIKLRSQGKTYNEIVQLTGLSKSNISYLCNKYVENNNIVHMNNCENEKPKKIARLKKFSQTFWPKKKDERIKFWTDKLNLLPLDEVRYMSGLYDGEGCHSAATFSISNSNIDIIRFILSFAKKLEAPVVTSLYLHITHNIEECKSYWGINFDFIRQYDSRNQKKNNSARENYGTVNVRFIKPLGLFEALRKFSLAHNIGLPGIEPVFIGYQPIALTIGR